MTVTTSEVRAKGEAAKATSSRMAALSTDTKNAALHAIADALVARSKEIVAANEAVDAGVLLVAPAAREVVAARDRGDDDRTVAHRRTEHGITLGVERVEEVVEAGRGEHHSVDVAGRR